MQNILILSKEKDKTASVPLSIRLLLLQKNQACETKQLYQTFTLKKDLKALLEET